MSREVNEPLRRVVGRRAHSARARDCCESDRAVGLWSPWCASLDLLRRSIGLSTVRVQDLREYFSDRCERVHGYHCRIYFRFDSDVARSFGTRPRRSRVCT